MAKSKSKLKSPDEFLRNLKVSRRAVADQFKAMCEAQLEFWHEIHELEKLLRVELNDGVEGSPGCGFYGSDWSEWPLQDFLELVIEAQAKGHDPEAEARAEEEG
jgi:hypothetical protein